MDRLSENKLVLVVRETRLEELKARFNTVSQARFYIERLGGDFTDYEQEDATYRAAVDAARQELGALGRVQVVPRALVPNFIFGPADIVVAIGQDGLVANTLKYLHGQPLVGVNPDPARYDGQLLPFAVPDLARIIPEVFRHARPTRAVTMARATLNNGQTLHAVNDLFIGPKSHGSARYTLHHNGASERHSSSGVIVSTGLGSTGWFSSLVAGAQAVSAALAANFTASVADPAQRELGLTQTADRPRRKVAFETPAPTRGKKLRFPSDAPHLFFTVREPFPSQTTGTELVFGRVTRENPLTLESHMAERGVIFSDGIESDFLEFNSGTKAEITLADRQGILVI